MKKELWWNILFILLLLALLGFFLFMAHQANGQTQSPTNLRLATNGPILPKIPVEFYTNTWFFAATARDTNGAESEYSAEVALTNIYSDTNPALSSVTLAWDPSPSIGISNYAVYWGTNCRTYGNTQLAGLSLTSTVVLIPPPPPPLTNLVVIASTTGGATDLWKSLCPSGPWSLIPGTNWVATNPPSPLYFRASGKKGSRVAINLLRV